jgi:ubiquitin-protein ligase
MHQSPRTRRLHNDLAALERLRADSSVFRFSTTGDPPQQYRIVFQGKGLYRDRGNVRVLDQHRVEIKLGASYPRSMPEIRWLTPVYHPNISEIGMVCLGGYGTHWVPSIQLDELCVMLWDMLRYHNYDIRSPYNRESALWTAGQTSFRFPIDARPLRDLRAAQGRGNVVAGKAAPDSDAPRARVSDYRRSSSDNPTPVGRVLQFIERYGRVFGEASTPQAPRTRPEVEGARRLIERAGQPADGRSPAPTRRNVTCDAPPSNVGLDAKTTSSADTDQVNHDGEQSDIVVLESSPDDARFEAPRPGGDDEVMFIS